MFSVSEGFKDLPVTLPCGQCWGCRLERSRQWAVRCVHEASLHEDNAFITLTYDDEHLPEAGSLDKTAFPKFMKRLRRRLGDDKVRYFHCGEYGEKTRRPHYHACLFGYDFDDKYSWAVRNGFPVWRSPFLEELWGQGNSEIGSVTFESAAYVARYILQKKNGPRQVEYDVVDPFTGEVKSREPEYTTMSRRPGIAKAWFDKFGAEVYPADEVIVRGHAAKPPRYYDNQYEIADPDGRELLAAMRTKKRKRKDETPARLAVREACTKARINRFPREFEQ